MHTCNNITLPERVAKRTTPSISVKANRQDFCALYRKNTDLQLVKLLQQHCHTEGWIVLIAPATKPNKAFWSSCQLPLDKILVVHQQHINDIAATIHQALCNVSCKVVINCAPLTDSELSFLTETASIQQSRFYTLDKMLDAAH